VKKILIIEDDEDIALLIKESVEKIGHEGLLSPTGEDGVQKAKEKRPDLIILDILLPDIDGFEVCRRVRNESSLKNTLILMLTSLQESVDLEKGYDAGADDYMRKPYETVELEKKMQALLRHISTPPYVQSQNICKLHLSCQAGQQIRIKGEGIFTCIDNSEEVLNIDPNIYAQHLFNFYQIQEWRFKTKQTGMQIFQTIFKKNPNIISAYTEALAKVDKSYQLSLSIESSLDFQKVPVEFLFDDITLGDYIVLNIPTSRFIEGIRIRNAPLSYEFLNELWENREPLKILLIASNTEPLLQHIDEEVQLLKSTLEEYLDAKDILHNIECIPTEKATLDFVTEKLRNCPYHILHFAGHGNYKDRRPGKSYLQFWSRENYEGDIERLDISALNRLLRNSRLCFVYLSCCQGSETAGSAQLLDEDFPGLAYGMAQAGIPSILGFRWDVPDKSATKLALSFYKSLFRQGSLEMALFEARNEIAIKDRDDITWMSPVLIYQE